MNEQEMLAQLSRTDGEERNDRTEAVLAELEADMPNWSKPYSDKEVEHVIADRRIAALLVLVCPTAYRDRVTKIAQAFRDGNYWQYY